MIAIIAHLVSPHLQIVKATMHRNEPEESIGITSGHERNDCVPGLQKAILVIAAPNTPTTHSAPRNALICSSSVKRPWLDDDEAARCQPARDLGLVHKWTLTYRTLRSGDENLSVRSRRDPWRERSQGLTEKGDMYVP